MALKTNTLDPDAQGKISERESFAVDARGQRHLLIVKTNEYANHYPEQSFFTEDDVWLRKSDGRPESWPDGKWKLFLTLRSGAKAQTYEAIFELNTGMVSLLGVTGEF